MFGDTPGQDMHSPFVEALSSKKDWAGLLCAWIAHGHDQALDRALQIVNCFAEHDVARWRPLACLLADLRNELAVVQHHLSQVLKVDWSSSEEVVIWITALFPGLVSWESAAHDSPGLKERLLHLAIRCGENMLRLSRRLDNRPALEARLLCELALVHLTLGDGQRAFALYGAALDLYRSLAAQKPDLYRRYVAETLGNLGTVYATNDSPEAARDYYTQAARLLDANMVDLLPRDMCLASGILYNLGLSQLRLETLPEARESFRQALAMRRQLFPRLPDHRSPDVCMILMDLGNANLLLDDLREARNSYHAALACLSNHVEAVPNSRHGVRGRICHNLCCVEKRLGNWAAVARRAAQAVVAFVDCEVLKPGQHSAELLAALRMLLSAVGVLDPAEARDRLEESLGVLNKLAPLGRGACALAVSGVHLTLGSVLQDLGCLSAACHHYGRALAASDCPARLPNGALQLLRGRAFAALGTLQDELGNWERASDAFSKALETLCEACRTQPSLLGQVGVTLSLLGQVKVAQHAFTAAESALCGAVAICRALGRVEDSGDRYEQASILLRVGECRVEMQEYRSAERHLKEALSVFQKLNQEWRMPLRGERCRCYYALGLIHLRVSSQSGEPDYDSARAAFRTARDLLDLRWTACARRGNGRKRIMRWDAVYDELFMSCISLWRIHRQSADLREALEVTEARRARALAELPSQEPLRVAGGPEGPARDLALLRRRILQVEQELAHEEDLFSFRSREGVAFHAASVIDAVEKQPPDKSVWPQQAFDGLASHLDRFERMKRRLERLRAAYRATRKRSGATRRRRSELPLSLPSMSYSQMQALIPTDKQTAVVYYSFPREDAVALLLFREGLEAVRLPGLSKTRLLKLAGDWCKTHARMRGLCSTAHRDRRSLGNLLADLLDAIHALATQPVLDLLNPCKVQRLIVVPGQLLHVLPLHAGRVADGQFLIDQYEMAYTPSLSLLAACLARTRPRDGHLLAIQNPLWDLPCAELETALASKRCASFEKLSGATATKVAVLSRASRCCILHYAGHAVYNPLHPMESALVLGSPYNASQWLKLRDVYGTLQLDENPLVVLTGCDTGLHQLDPYDEYVGWPGGFLHAGASCVVSSLWAVDDFASALLMDRFYAGLLAGNSVCSALREAQRWLRQDIVSGVYLRDEVVTEELLRRLTSEEERQIFLRAAEYLARESPDCPPFCSPFYWASFVANGLSFQAGTPVGVRLLGRT